MTRLEQVLEALKDTPQEVVVDGVKVERYGTGLKADGRITLAQLLFGDVSRSRARKFRKAFRAAGWYCHAAMPATRTPKGYKVHCWEVARIPIKNVTETGFGFDEGV